jgi:GGDEF domain-containing protein
MRLPIISRIVIAAGFALAASILVVAAMGPTGPGWLSAGAAAMLWADIAGCITWGWSARRRRGKERAAFLCVTAIFAIWASAALVWLLSLRDQGEIESLLIIQAGYVGVAVLGFASLILIYLHYRDHPGWEGPVDAGIVALSSIVLLWTLVIPNAGKISDGWLARVGTAYLALMGGLAVAVGGMVVWRGSAIHRWLRWALAGITFLAADIALSLSAQPSHEHVRLRLAGMAAGVLASTCLAVAALRREAADDQPAADGGPVHVARSRARRILPAVTMLGAVTAIASDDGVVGLIAIGAVVLVLAQVLGTLEFVERLLDERSRWAATDTLTGAYNRRQFDADLPRLIAGMRRSGRPLTAMLIDIDHFKAVNDSHGHVVGDAVLQGICTAVAAELRAADPLFRIGGDEFMVWYRRPYRRVRSPGPTGSGRRLPTRCERCCRTGRS